MGRCRQMMEVGEPNTPKCTKMVQDGPLDGLVRATNHPDKAFYYGTEGVCHKDSNLYTTDGLT